MLIDLEIFENNPLFKNFSKEEIEEIIINGEIKEYDTGAEILGLIDRTRYLTIVINGKASATKQNGEKTIFLRHLGAGEIFGVASLLSEEPYITIVTAVRKSKVFRLDEEKVTKLIHKNGVFAENYIRFLTSRIKYLGDKIDAYTSVSAESRIARYLLSLTENSCGQVILNVSLSKLAELLDIGRASLYRVLNEFSEQKLIERNGRIVYNIKRERIQELF